MRKNVFTCILIAIVVMFSAFPALADEQEVMYAICRDGSVNVRAQPTSKARVEGYLEFGWDVTVTDSKVDGTGTLWYKIVGTTELGYGWVCSQYLIRSKPENVSWEATICANGRVAAHKRVNGARKCWVSPGAKVQVKIFSEDWCLTDKGYVKTEYLQIDE